MRAFLRLYDRVISALAVLAGAGIAFAVTLDIYDVAVRALGMRPPGFTVATIEYVLLYFTLCAAPYLVRKKGHVYIDALTSRLPVRLRWIVDRFAYLASIVTCLLFAYISFGLLVDAFRSGLFDERSIDIPMWLLYLPMPPAFFLAACEFGRYFFGVDTFYAERTKAQDSA